MLKPQIFYFEMWYLRDYDAISFHFVEGRMGFLSKKTALKSTFVKESYMQPGLMIFTIFNDKSPQNDYLCK